VDSRSGIELSFVVKASADTMNFSGKSDFDVMKKDRIMKKTNRQEKFSNRKLVHCER
jgi:hypothetical protein